MCVHSESSAQRTFQWATAIEDEAELTRAKIVQISHYVIEWHSIGLRYEIKAKRQRNKENGEPAIESIHSRDRGRGRGGDRISIRREQIALITSFACDTNFQRLMSNAFDTSSFLLRMPCDAVHIPIPDWFSFRTGGMTVPSDGHCVSGLSVGWRRSHAAHSMNSKCALNRSQLCTAQTNCISISLLRVCMHWLYYFYYYCYYYEFYQRNFLCRLEIGKHVTRAF